MTPPVLTRFPIRFIVPLLLVTVASALAAIGYVSQVESLTQSIRVVEAQGLRQLLGSEQGRLEDLLELKNDLELQKAVSSLALRGSITHAWLVDAKGHVVASLLRTDVGRTLSEVPVTTSPAFRQARDQPFEGGSATTLHIGDMAADGALLGVIEIAPRHRLLVRMDVSLSIARAKHMQRARFIAEAGTTLLVASLLGGFLHIVWFRRTRQLTSAVTAIAAGGFDVRTGIGGRDELAHIGDAIDHMAESLQKNQARLFRLTRFHAMLSQCNEVIVRCTSEAELFRKLCRVAVEFGGMKMAWIGFVDPDTSMIPPADSFGDHADEYLSGLQVTADGRCEAGRGPTGVAAREDRPVWCQDFQNDPLTAPWRERGARFGFHASAALPLHRNGAVVGVLTLYSGEVEAFDEDVRELLIAMATDISFALGNFAREAARRQADAALIESKALIDAVVENVPLMIFLKEATDLRFVVFNRAGEELLGCDRKDLLGKNDMDFFPPEQAARFTAKDREVLDGELSILDIPEEAITTARKDERLLHTRKVCVRGRDGKTKYLLGISEDITERKRAQQALEASDARFRAVVASAPAAIVVAQAGKIVLWNQGAERLFQYSRQEAMDQPVTMLIPEPYLTRHGEAVQRFHASGETRLPGKSYEAQALRKDGSQCPVQVSLAVWQSAQGAFASAIITDITEREQAENALRESEAEMKEAQRVAHVGSWSWVIETDTVTWSEEFFRIAGRDPAGTPPNYFRNHATLYTPESLARLQALVERATRTGEPYEADLELIRPDGTARWVMATGEVRRDANGQIVGLRGTVEDITEQRRLQAQLLHAQKMEAIGRLAGGVAHDFNNVLTVIGGYSEMLLKALPDDEPAYRQATEIGVAAKRAAALTRQLLTFSRKQVFELKVVDLNTIVNGILGFLSRLLGEDVEIVFRPQKGLGLVNVDPGQIEQVIMNLSVNARDAMPHGGKLILETQDVELDESYARAHPSVAAGPYVLLAASDTGCGMTPETVSHLFEPFFTTKELGKGTGLGLSTVFGIVKQSGGEISVYSVPGEGTTFKIYLPRVRAETGERDQASSPAILRARPGETVLMVEDDEAVGRLTHWMLSDLGYEVLAATRGEEALETAAHHPGPIDLLLTDMLMPGIRGPEVANRLLVLRPETRVVFMSGYAEELVLNHAAVQGTAVFLQKPFTSSTLGAKLREALDAVPLPGPMRKKGSVPGEQQGTFVHGGRKPLSILQMDDDKDILEITSFFLAEDGHRVVGCLDVEETVARYTEALARGERFDLVILDLSIPGKKGGVEGMREILKLDPTAKIVACSGAGPSEVGPLESGFIGIVEKPFTSESLKAILHLL